MSRNVLTLICDAAKRSLIDNFPTRDGRASLFEKTWWQKKNRQQFESDTRAIRRGKNPLEEENNYCIRITLVFVVFEANFVAKLNEQKPFCIPLSCEFVLFVFREAAGKSDKLRKCSSRKTNLFYSHLVERFVVSLLNFFFCCIAVYIFFMSKTRFCFIDLMASMLLSSSPNFSDFAFFRSIVNLLFRCRYLEGCELRKKSFRVSRNSTSRFFKH